MGHSSRRQFLARTSTGLGVTFIGAAALSSAANAREQPERPTLPAALPLGDLSAVQPMVLHVRDAAAGEVALMVGTREVVYRDAALVAHLVQAARQGSDAEG